MELTPWRPFGAMPSFRKEMDDLWNRFFGEIPLARTFGGEWTPRADISETKDNFVVKTELPGLEVKDVNVSISCNFLNIKGEKKKEEEKNLNNIGD